MSSHLCLWSFCVLVKPGWCHLLRQLLRVRENAKCLAQITHSRKRGEICHYASPIRVCGLGVSEGGEHKPLWFTVYFQFTPGVMGTGWRQGDGVHHHPASQGTGSGVPCVYLFIFLQPYIFVYLPHLSFIWLHHIFQKINTQTSIPLYILLKS